MAHLDGAQTGALADAVMTACREDALVDARSALPLLLASLPSGSTALPCAPTLVRDTFALRHWALIHQTGGAFIEMSRANPGGPAGGRHPRTLVPPSAAVGGVEAVKGLVRAMNAPGARAAAAAVLASPQEAAALEADAGALYELLDSA